MKALTILYHDVVDNSYDASGFPGAAAARYKLRRDEFKEHLEKLHGIARTPAEGVDGLLDGNKTDVFLFTIDDGGSSASYIADQLEGLDWRGHFFITTDKIGSPAFVDKGQIRDLHERGHVIGSHSCSHPHRMADLSPQRLAAEWRESVAELSDIIGEPVLSGSVPGGFYRRNVAVAAANAGIKALFTSEPTTKVERLGECLILGRYNVYRGMSANAAGALIGRSSYARVRQQFIWNGKKAIKTAAAPVWDRTRELVFGRQG